MTSPSCYAQINLFFFFKVIIMVYKRKGKKKLFTHLWGSKKREEEG